jgi:uncharacterized membrane protein YozB (DUF420 family)
MTLHDLPAVNATLNGIAALLLASGWLAIRWGRREMHRAFMISAIVASAVFLACYLYYHAHHLVTRYEGQGFMRALYFFILTTHVVLAAVVPPFVIAALIQAFRGRFDRHARITRWLWPVWMYVSVTGVLVYLMLYVL